jgi:hypothetical protein
MRSVALEEDVLCRKRTSPLLADFVAKSKVPSVRIFGETLKGEVINDSHNLSRATKVAYEFSARR